jgi:membrane-bound ClpP family serine protease
MSDGHRRSIRVRDLPRALRACVLALVLLAGSLTGIARAGEILLVEIDGSINPASAD